MDSAGADFGSSPPEPISNWVIIERKYILRKYILPTAFIGPRWSSIAINQL
jgi:hypothetical protein